MKRRLVGALCATVPVLLTACTSRTPTPAAVVQGAPDQPMARGVVFHDRDGDGLRDAGEPGIGGVRVSNGREIVTADRRGRYALPVSDDCTLFVIKPRDWMTRVDELNIPRFYYVHKPAGTPALKYPAVAPTGALPETIDFALTRRPEPERFDVLILGDTQVRAIEEVDYLAHDVIEPLAGTRAAFAMSLGDLVFDALDVQGPLNRALALLGVPVYNVLGNHDMDYAATDDRHSDDHFEACFGPPYYSFDYGPVHFVVLEDVVWHGKTAERDGYYTPGLGAAQLAWLRRDLALAPRDQLVVLVMHIPLVEFKDPERRELFALLADRPHCISFSAHWHSMEQRFLDVTDGWPGATPHHHTIVPTACGSWWQGAPDELGIPHTMMGDGAPNGWTIATFSRRDYTFRFVPARRPADYQLHIHTPEPVAGGDETGAGAPVLVNVFAGNERSTVRLRVDGGAWQTLAREKREDPYFLAIKAAEKSPTPPPGRKLPAPAKTPHMWVGRLPADLAPGCHLVEVEARDMFGQVHLGRRIVRCAAP